MAVDERELDEIEHADDWRAADATVRMGGQLPLLAKVRHLATAAAKRYARTVFWAAPLVPDMEQEAAWAMLDAAPRWDPTVGVPLGAFLWVAAVRWLRGWLLKQSSPVSGNREEMAGLCRAPLKEDMQAPSPSAESELHAMRVRAAMRGELLEVARLADAEPWARAVLDGDLDHDDRAGIAAALDCTPQEASRLRHRFRRHAVVDAALYDLWKEEA